MQWRRHLEMFRRLGRGSTPVESTARASDPAALNRLGDERLRVRREDEALACWLDAADRWARDGFYAKSIAVYRKILRLRPGHPQARERLAWTYVESGLPIHTRR